MSVTRSAAPARPGLGDAADLRSFERSLPMALMRAREAVMAHFRPILTAHDLTEQQWRVLRALIAIEGPCSVGDIADRTFLLGPSLSRMLVSLEDRRLIDRSTAATDARRSEISISSTGRALVAEIAPKSELAYAEINERFGPGELDQLYDLLERAASIE